MTIETKTTVTYGNLTVEQAFKWDALSSVSKFLFSPLTLIARLGEADRIDHERGRPHDFVGDRKQKPGPKGKR